MHASHIQISQAQDVIWERSLGGGQPSRVQPAGSWHGLVVQLYSVAVSLPVKHQQPGDKLGRFWRNTPNDVTSSNVGALIFGFQVYPQVVGA